MLNGRCGGGSRTFGVLDPPGEALNGQTVTTFTRFGPDDPILGTRTSDPDFRVTFATAGYRLLYRYDQPGFPPSETQDRAVPLTFTPTVVPEPTSFVLASGGLLILCAVRRRRNA